MSGEDAMLEALVASGVKVEPGKRYTLSEVCAIYANKPGKESTQRFAATQGPLPYELVGALVESPVSKGRVGQIEREALRKLREAVGVAA